MRRHCVIDDEKGKMSSTERRSSVLQVEADEELDEVEEEKRTEMLNPKTVGEPIRVSMKGWEERVHFNSFEYQNDVYHLEDTVLITPPDLDHKPLVAIIKEIFRTVYGCIMLTGQWLYRPEEAVKQIGGNWISQDARELFYSFHRDDIPAESVLHKCTVHFIPRGKQLPSRKEHPGFIVQRVYDTKEKKLWSLMDKDYTDDRQTEIDILVKKTMSYFGELRDVSYNTGCKRKYISSKWERASAYQPLEAQASGCHANSDAEFLNILKKFKVTTGDFDRDKGMVFLLKAVQVICIENKDLCSWPDAAVRAVSDLENALYNASRDDNKTYKQKLRQLAYNLKNNSYLTRRLLTGELEGREIVGMSPEELKDGTLIAEKTTKDEPAEPEKIQMTTNLCSRCKERKVCLTDVIHSVRGDRYQLMCNGCGHNWYASRDDVRLVEADKPTTAGTAKTQSSVIGISESRQKKETGLVSFLRLNRAESKRANNAFRETFCSRKSKVEFSKKLETRPLNSKKLKARPEKGNNVDVGSSKYSKKM